MKYKNDFDAEKIKFLTTGEMTENPVYAWDAYRFQFDKEEQELFWKINRKKILKDFIENHPGKRPYCWWCFDAPEMRRRLGGIGDPRFEHLGVSRSFSFGVPDDFVSQFEADYYNGKARHVNGGFIPCKWKEGDFKGVAVDPKNPPVYETELEYLTRHDFLTKTEIKLLKLQKCK